MRHGGDLGEAMARHGGDEADWLDLSTGINPHAWPVPPGLASAGLGRLPSRADLDRLVTTARAAYRVPEHAGIAAAPGTQAIIQWLPRTAPRGPVAILGPTYGEHAASWRAAGREVHEVAGPADTGAAPNAVLVRPNNPDGRLLDRGEVAQLARGCATRGGWLVIDESFVDTCPGESMAGLVTEAPVVVLRSFGKFFGLAGLRLGFAIAPPRIGEEIAAALGPWAVAGPALAIGAAALADTHWAEATRGRLAAESSALDEILHAEGHAVLGGTSLFRLARHPEAQRIHQELAAARIWVRSFAHDPELLRFGLPPDDAARGRIAEALRSATNQAGRALAGAKYSR